MLIDLDDAGIGSRYLDLGWAFIMQFVEHTEQMRLSYRFDLAQAFLEGYYGTARISRMEYDLLWQGAVYMHISYMQSYGPVRSIPYGISCSLDWNKRRPCGNYFYPSR